MNISQILVSTPGLADAARLSALCNTTFYDTYHSYNTPANMDAYMKENFNIDRIKEELADTNTHFFIASINNKAIAYVKLKKVNMPSEYAHEQGMEIERIYVKQAHKGLKIGSELMQKSMGYARSIGCDAIWLGVWEHNHNAIAFYKKWGFSNFGSHIFMLGDDAQNDHLLYKIIDGGLSH